MAELFKSAFGYLGANGAASDNDFVGQEVEINGIKLRIRKLIAEGKDWRGWPCLSLLG